MSYEFCLNEPAMIFRLSIRNVATRAVRLSAYTHLKATLRTCQTYARIDSASTTVGNDSSTLMIRYPEREAGMSCLMVGNAGRKPASWTTDASELAIVDSGASRWLDSGTKLGRRLFPNGATGERGSGLHL